VVQQCTLEKLEEEAGEAAVEEEEDEGEDNNSDKIYQSSPDRWGIIKINLY
jgi:hypothetical protein